METLGIGRNIGVTHRDRTAYPELKGFMPERPVHSLSLPLTRSHERHSLRHTHSVRGRLLSAQASHTWRPSDPTAVSRLNMVVMRVGGSHRKTPVKFEFWIDLK